MFHILFGILAIYASVYVPLWIIAKIIQCLRYGFDFGKIRAADELLREAIDERRRKEKLEADRTYAEWQKKLRENGL